MRNELSALTREASKIRAQLGSERRTVVFRLLDGEGNETGLLNINGTEWTGSTDDVCCLDVVAVAFSALSRRARHTVLHGGRAGGKSWTIALFLVAIAYTEPLKILCVREVQLSIRDSVHSLLKQIIESEPVFRDFFEIFESEIRGRNGSVFAFRGMRKESAHSIKSYEGFDVAWCEESQALSRRSIDLLIPTVRRPGSRLIWSLNPEFDDQPVYVDFLATSREDTAKVEVLYTDNWFRSSEVDEMALHDKRTDPAKFRHVWAGGLREKGVGQILDHYTVIENIDFDELPNVSFKDRKRYGPYYTPAAVRKWGKGAIFCGCDPGHSDSPTHLTVGWFSEERRRATIIDEYHAEKASPNEVAKGILEKLPFIYDRRIPVWCDPAATGDIQTLKEHGLNARAAKKWPCSENDGITRLKSIEIAICERCEHTINDFSMWSWKLDANGVPTGIPEDVHDHGPDSVRYALHRWIKSGSVVGYGKLKDVWR